MSAPISFLAQPVPGNEEQVKALEEVKRKFTMKTDLLQDLAANLRKEMDQGLECKKANVPMLPSCITRRPSGSEEGEYIGLELSASTIRIYLVELQGNGHISVTKKRKHTVHESLKKCDITTLIDFLAGFVDSFLTSIGKSGGPPVDLGFVVSFPLEQTGANKAYVIKWTKDFNITGADGKDIGELLQSSLQTKHIPANVKAVVNSVAGCLLAQNYTSQDTLLACTISTGTNAAYWEDASAVKKAKTEDGGETIINTEWGSFGDANSSYLPRTKYDNMVNRLSQYPGVHCFEKMVSGLYLGELARVIMIDLLDRRLLFDTHYSNELNKPYAFETSYVNRVCEDGVDLRDTRYVLESLMGLKTTETDRQIVKMICELVCQRAARLTAAAISAIVDKRDKINSGLTVSVEGDIYEYFTNFPRRVHEALSRLYGDRVDHIKIQVLKNGNVIGAAVAAMLANEQA